MMMRCSRFLGGVLVLLATQPCLAQTFQAPATIDYGGRVFKQAVKAEKAEEDGRSVFEYTAGGDSANAPVLTLDYTPGKVSDPLTWAKAWMAKFDKESPKPNSYYFFRPKQETAYAQIITRPDAKRPYYESSVWKSFHLPECGGLVVLQYAEKFPASTLPPPADPKSDEQLREIFPKNIEAAEILDAFAWKPSCGKAEN
jgi:hypothetical protein